MMNDDISVLLDVIIAKNNSLVCVGLDSEVSKLPKHLKNVKYPQFSIVSAPEGIKRMQKNHSDVKIFTAAIDDHLNDRKFIVPGLGDFGDRYFGT